MPVIIIAVFIAGPAIGATVAYKDAEPRIGNGAILAGFLGAGFGVLISCIIDGFLLSAME